MGPKCPTCRLPVGVKGMASFYRVSNGRRCRACGSVFRFSANETTFAAVAMIGFAALLAGGVTLALVGGALRLPPLAARVLVAGVMVIGAGAGFWFGLKTKPISPTDEHCVHCGHDITGWTGEQCPECGVSFFVRPPVPKDDAPQ